MSDATKKAGSAKAEATESSLLNSVLSKLEVDVDTSSPMSFQNAQAPDRTDVRMTYAIEYLLRSVAGKSAVQKVDTELIDSIIAQLDERLSLQMDEILHNEQFKKLESAWRGLKFLVDRTNFRANIKIEMLNVSKDALMEDLEETAGDLTESGLFQHMYKKEYDQAGGEPFGTVIGNYEFDRSPGDIDMLKNVSKVCAACHAPFISSVGHKFFGVKTIEEIPHINNLATIFEAPEYIQWRSFRESEDSRYVGLTLPRFLLRLPYGPEDKKVSLFNYKESVEDHHENYLWGNTAFSHASVLTRSFYQHGWATSISGPEGGGTIEDMPIHKFKSMGDTQVKPPTEIYIPDSHELEFAELGFIPLIYYKNQDKAVFFSSQSAQKPKQFIEDQDTANAALPAKLNYLFLVSRLTHYIKVMQRQNIGSWKERDDVEAELTKWLKSLTTEMPNPSEDLRARCPLKEASLHVVDNPARPGWYSVSISVRPHFKLEGMDVGLSLVTSLPKKA